MYKLLILIFKKDQKMSLISRFLNDIRKNLCNIFIDHLISTEYCPVVYIKREKMYKLIVHSDVRKA